MTVNLAEDTSPPGNENVAHCVGFSSKGSVGYSVGND
jgi:hypothetical protein